VLGSAPAGPPSTRLRALLSGCALVDFPVAAAFDVARLRGRVPGTDLVTGAVVLAALAAGAAVVTGEPERYRAVALALGVDIGLVNLIDEP
jgi:hypothetical protein